MKIDNLNSSTTINGNVEVTNDVGGALPISGSVTANAGTNLSTAALALEAGGNLAAIAAKDFATSAKQDTQITALNNIDSDTSTIATNTGNTATSVNNIDGKLPAAAAPADAVSNAESATSIRARLIGFNGTTWDRIRTAVTTVSATFTGFLNSLPWAIYNATPTTRTEGQGGPLQANSDGSLKMYLASVLDSINDSIATIFSTHSNTNTSAQAASLVIKGSAGRCIAIRGYNAKVSAQFIQVHDASSLPADAAVPEESFTVAASSNFEITFPEEKSFTTGIVVCNSSTQATKTIGSADCWFSADYR